MSEPVERSVIEARREQTGSGNCAALSDASQLLVVFTRFPEPGKTKTRLIPALGADGAAKLHGRMTDHTLRWAERLGRRRRLAVDVRFEGGTAGAMAQRFGDGFRYRPQPHGDLGKRMARTFSEALEGGVQRAVIVGTDCPGLTAELAQEAFAALEHSDVVLGPANDGGYYLIGLRRTVPELFTGIAWGSGGVFASTVRLAARLGLSVHLLQPLDDVDRPEDLAVWHRAIEMRQAVLPVPAPKSAGMLSVIIPARNEAGHLPRTLATVQHAPETEVIVVDGQSGDETRRIAHACGAHVLGSAAGRARQMNAGAEAAQGDVLLFLHADTRLPEGFRQAVDDALSQSQNAAGAFDLCIDAAGRGLRWIERGVNLRSRYLHMPYGDQALFVRKETFRSVGGYPDLPIMEDVELVRRVRRHGRIAIVPLPVVTSARRWLKLGLCRTTLRNQWCLSAYMLGVSPWRIARWYRRPRRRQPGSRE